MKLDAAKFPLKLGITLLPFIFGLWGCSSAHKRAHELMEGQDYVDAIEAYEAILREDSGDTEAKIGLMQARTKWIDHQLIEVRLTRLAGNEPLSVHLLNGILTEEKNWMVFPVGAVAFTQNEETEYATHQLSEQISQALKLRQPLRAHWISQKDAYVFDKISNTQHDLLVTQMNTVGADDCQKLQKASQTAPYYRVFVNKYCAYWNVTPSNSGAVQKKIDEQLLSGLQLDGEITALPPLMKAQFESDLNSALQKTAWFDSAAVHTAKVNAAGSFEYNREVAPQSLYHNYTVEIPYTDYETVYKSREVPYTDSEYAYNAVTGKYENQTVSKTRTEWYTEQQPVTRYRSEPRVFAFQGQKFSERIKLELSTSVQLDKVKKIDLRSAFQKEFNDSEDVHDVSMPAIGLKPKHLSLPEQDEWLNAQSKEFAKRVSGELAQKWISSFCDNTDKNLKSMPESELVFKCLRQPVASYPTFTENWFQAHLGLDISETNRMVGFLNTL